MVHLGDCNSLFTIGIVNMSEVFNSVLVADWSGCY